MTKFYLKGVFTLLLLLILPTALHSQPEEGILRHSYPHYSGATPITNTIDYCTGRAIVNIPLFEFKTADQNIPISLVYQGGGVKVADSDQTLFGVGWRMTGTGHVTRIMMDKPDEINKTGGWSQDLSNLYTSMKNTYGTFIEGNYESDLYYFESPTVSGMFVMDVNKNVCLLPYQNVSVTWTGTASSNYFIIKDSSGNTYTYGSTAATREQTESTIIYDSGNTDVSLTYISTWHLEKIESFKGEVITYTYDALDDITENHKTNWFKYVIPRYDKTEVVTLRKVIKGPKALKEIKWDDKIKVILNRSNRNFRVSSISLDHKGSMYGLSPTYYFSYLNENSTRKLLLSGIYKSMLAKTNPVVEFSYYNPTRYMYWDRADWWGYCNGTATTPPAEGSTAVLVPKSDPVLDQAQNYSLKNITIPYGGKKEFIYELNDYTASNGTLKQCGGIRVKEIKETQSGKTSSTKYTYKDEQGRSSGVVFQEKILSSWSEYKTVHRQYYFESPLNDLFDIDGRHIIYSSVKETFPDGTSTKYDFTTSKDSGAGDSPSIVRHKLIANNGLEDSFVRDNERPFYIGNADFLDNSVFWRRGLLKEKTEYAANGAVTVNQKYEYVFGPSVKTVRGFQHAKCYGPNQKVNLLICEYKWESQPVYLKKITTASGPHNFEATEEYTYNTNYMVPVKYVLTDCEGVKHTTNYRYPFNISVTGTVAVNSPAYALQQLREKNVCVPVETEYYKNNQLIRAELIEYKRYFNPGRREFMVPYRSYTIKDNKSTLSFANYNGYVKDSRYELDCEFHSWDNDGRLICIVAHDQVRSFIYDDHSMNVIAEVTNAVHRTNGSDNDNNNVNLNQVYHNSFSGTGEDLAFWGGNAKSGYRAHYGVFDMSVKYLATGKYMLSYWQSSTRNGPWTRVMTEIDHPGGTLTRSLGASTRYIDEIRLHPVDARMTTYTYAPYFNAPVLSITDTNEFTTHYKYDNQGRVVKVLNDRLEVVTEYEYGSRF